MNNKEAIRCLQSLSRYLRNKQDSPRCANDLDAIIELIKQYEKTISTSQGEKQQNDQD